MTKIYETTSVPVQGAATASDLRFENHGSLFLLRPLTERGEQWVEENLGSETLKLGNGIAVEPRYVTDIFEGAVGDGLVVG